MVDPAAGVTQSVPSVAHRVDPELGQFGYGFAGVVDRLRPVVADGRSDGSAAGKPCRLAGEPHE